MEEVTINYHADNENFAEIIVQETNTGCAQSIEMSREAYRQLETLIANNPMSAGAASSNEDGALPIQHVGQSLPDDVPLFIDWLDKYFEHYRNDALYKEKRTGKIYPQSELYYKHYKKAYKL
jgi:hypothetical protein